jgi:hypothetical protein
MSLYKNVKQQKVVDLKSLYSMNDGIQPRQYGKALNP